MNYQDFFQELWSDYIKITPSAHKVHQIFSKEQNEIINDHVAFRTFNTEKIGLNKLARHFEDMGYKNCGDYEFIDKKLKANHFEHSDPKAPKVFISELELEKCSDKLNTIVNRLTDQVNDGFADKPEFLFSGAPWKVSHEDYLSLLEESEYAAWMSAWGYHANHFTVSINHLDAYSDIQSVNQKLKDEGFVLNSSGGEIKGTPEVLLEQSSTMADKMDVAFIDKTTSIPSCFYEFALRYPMPNGEIYSGFVAANADKIFDSTNVK